MTVTFRTAAVALAIMGLAAAIVAARYWWNASKVPIAEPVASITDVPALHIFNTQVAFYESSQLNGRAAIWTGIAAVLSALASVMGVL